MNTQAVISALRRLGEVPPPGTDDRRSWLLALTEEQTLALTRVHGTDQTVFSDCLTFGAYQGGTDDELVSCSVCHRARFPLWFLTEGRTIAKCWNCAAIAHLTICDLWENDL